MVTDAQLAAFAMNAYTPSQENRVNVEGWEPLTQRQGEPDGFGASAFINADGEVVVAFRGTDTEPLLNIDWLTGNTAALGKYNAQVERAIEFIADILADPRVDISKVTLTGHSLGGGLASVMAVFFNLRAFTFAAAPFELTAVSEEL